MRTVRVPVLLAAAGSLVAAVLLAGCTQTINHECEAWFNGGEIPDRMTRDWCLDHYRGEW